MPLQQISLDQSIYNKKPRSPVSQALRPKPVQGAVGGGFAAAGGNEPNRFVEEQKAKWAEEDKAKKAERDMQMTKAQELGMRVGDVLQKGAQQQVQQQARQQATAQQIEDNPEPAAKEAWNFMLSLPEENQQAYANEVFAPTHAGGTMSSGGKTVTTAPKYNAIANVWLEKGWVKFDEKGNVHINRPEDVFESGTFKEKADGSLFNSATGETVIEAGDIPIGFTAKEIADGLNYGRLYMGSLTEPTLLEKITPEKMSAFMDNAREESRKATENYLYALGRGRGLTRKQAHDIAYGLSDKDLGGGGTTTEPPEGGETRIGIEKNWDAPLDEENAKNLAKFWKENPNMATAGLIEETKKKIVEEPTVKEEKKVKDYFSVNKYSPL
ncbi:MAG: hypothetical protein ACTSQA_09415 [Candidatus Heimdallarchaeaceae archaeon]